MRTEDAPLALPSGTSQDTDAPRRARWRAWFTPKAVTVPTQRRAEVSTYTTGVPGSHSALRTWADRHTARVGVPDPGRLKASAGYWMRTAPRLLVVAVPKLTVATTAHIVPVFRGLGSATEAYFRWLAVPQLAAAALAADNGNKKSDKLTHYHHVKSRRTLMSLAGAAGAVGGGWYLYVVHPWWLLGIAAVLLGIADWAGWRGQPTKEFEPVKRQMFSEGMPPRQLTEGILAVFAEEGLKVAVAGVIQLDFQRKQYRLEVSTYDKLTPEHMRAIERGVGFPDDSVRLLRVPETATSKIMVVQYGDPIPVLPSIPDRAVGSLTINDAMVLGESTGDYPFALHFAGSHVIVMGTTGAAKSSVHLTNIIDSLSVCRDVIMWGVDLTRGPLFSMWRGVIQRKAYTPDEADALLGAAIEEIDRRAQILDDIANDDDPTNDTSEWHTGLGPALVVIIDEFPELAKYNGVPKDTLNLLEKVERIYRTGRKHLVSLVIGIQKMGNADTGSTVVSSQSGQVIAGPCTERDTVAVFGTEGRDFGYAPHNLRPGTKTALNDAGKAFVSAPGFGPDVVRGYGALAPGEIKRRARDRETAGLPTLGGPAGADIEAVIVPPALGAIDAALTGLRVDAAPTKLVVAHANAAGGKWTAVTLAATLKTEAIELGVTPPVTKQARSELSGGDPVAHYRRTDIAPMLAALE